MDMLHNPKCKALLVHCKALLQFVYYRSHLTKHQEIYEDMLRRRQEKLAQTELSQQFMFGISQAFCKMCDYKISIFCNMRDLEFHLEMSHANEYLYKKKGDNNAHEIVQQSVGEISYADPRSDHDDTLKRSSGNQKDQN